MIDSFHSSNNSFFKMELISVWVSTRIDLPLVLINSAGILSIPKDLYHFSFSKAITISWGQAPVALLYVFQSNIINSTYIQQLREIVPPPSQNTVAVCNQITISILNCSTSRLATLLNVTDAPVQVSDILVLTVSYMFSNVSFQSPPFCS